MGRAKLQYGIRVKGKRSLNPDDISYIEDVYGSNIYGKYLIRDINFKKYFPKNAYTISGRYVRKFASRKEAELYGITSYERVVKIDPSICW